jgi:predicted RND superfamily exporter protein
MDRLFARYIAFSRRHAGTLTLLFAALCIATLLPAIQLQLHTDMAELLPDDHPAVVALRRLSGRQKSSTNLVMLVESPDAQANQRFAVALKPELARLIPSVFSEIQWAPETEVPDFADRWRWLYADKKDLESAESLLDRLIARREQPLAVDLEGDPEAELKSLRERLNSAVPVANHADYFEGHDGDKHYLGVMMWRRGDGLATLGDLQTLAAARAVVEKLNPVAFNPLMKVEFSGHIAMAIDEHNAVRDDLTMATVICTSLVLLAIYLYFRRGALLIVIGSPAVLGVLCALCVARFTLHSLNANTAFLISIILGNGINAPIILLARYGEERRRGVEVGAALETAMSSTLLATATAMLAASVAYGCLLLTRFRGFNQFGLVGGAGMLFVWLLTFLMVPPMVLFGERLKPGLLTPRHNLWRAPFDLLGRIAANHPRLLALASLLVLALSLPPLARWLRDPLEWNFGNLNTAETGSQKRWGKMYQLGMGNVGAGYIATDGVILVDRAEQADLVAAALREKDRALGPEHILREVRTLDSMLPDEQSDKLEVLSRVRRKIDRNRERMSGDEQREVEAWRPPDYLRVLTTHDLPRRIRENFTEVDGTIGRLIGIDADPKQFKYSGWHGYDIVRVAHGCEVDALGTHWEAASSSNVFAGMLQMMLSDGPRVMLAALIGVTLLVLIAFGRGAVPVLMSLAIGVVWLGGLAASLKLKLNFVNFVALPITLGIGADYAANIWARLRREGTTHLRQVIADTGSAVALCSMTTIIGYSSLLLASNRALKSFGLLADLGEVTCLLAALLALPALVRFGSRAQTS